MNAPQNTPRPSGLSRARAVALKVVIALLALAYLGLNVYYIVDMVRQP